MGVELSFYLHLPNGYGYGTLNLTSHLGGYEVVSHHFSMMTNGVFSCAYGLFTFNFWRHTCSDPLSSF